MPVAHLAYYAAYLNQHVSWRFSWYWQVTGSRLKRILVPESVPTDVSYAVANHLPGVESTELKPKPPMEFAPFELGSLYDLTPGAYHSLVVLPRGPTPVVSCGDSNNGICGYYDIDKKNMCRDKMTIALNGATLAAKYHPYDFAAKDDVAICFPKESLRITTELFIQVMLRRERWRFSYYRKCYQQKLNRLKVLLPVKGSTVDQDSIESVITATPYWPFLSEQLPA